MSVVDLYAVIDHCVEMNEYGPDVLGKVVKVLQQILADRSSS